MDNSEALQLLEELDSIRSSAGMPKMDEASRRDFLKKMGAGAVAAAGAATGMAMPKDAKAWGDVPEGEANEHDQEVMMKLGMINRLLAMMDNTIDKSGENINSNDMKKLVSGIRTIVGDITVSAKWRKYRDYEE